jgi:hypothetical protein
MKKIKGTILTLFAFVGAISAPANNYTVTTTNDSGPGSLRAIIIEANGVEGPNTINFGNSGNLASGGTIMLVSPLPQITQGVTIAGWLSPGETINAIAIAGSSLAFGAGTTNNLQQLDIVGSITFGPGSSNSLQQMNVDGCITNGQSLSITECVITNGGIQSVGILQMTSSSVIASPTVGIWSSGNAILNEVAVSLCSGGGIYNAGTMSITNSLILSNICPTNGGGIYSANSLQMTGCQIIANVTTNGTGGGIFNAGAASIVQTWICSNIANASFGGGIYDSGQLSLVGSLVAQNKVVGQSGGTYANGGGAGGFGGGLYVAGNQVSLTNTTLFGNTASGGAGGGGGNIGFGGSGSMGAGPSGGAGGLGSSSGPGGSGQNGGFASGGGGGGGGSASNNNDKGGNGGAGGFGGGGGSGGVAWGGYGLGGSGLGWGGSGCSDNGGGGAGLGSAVFVFAGSVQMVNCTIAQNQVSGGFNSCGSQYWGHGVAAIYNYGGSVALLNTIVATNSSATSDPPDVYGAFTSEGYNFIGNSTGSSGWNSVTDFQNAVPLSLGPLQNNGGPTLTCALLSGSLCILGGTSVGAPPTDQRGAIRPPNNCDIGAYQYTTQETPIISTEPESQISLAESNVSFTASAIGIGPFYYQWQLDGTNIAGATSSTLTIPVVQTNLGTYAVVVTNLFGTNTSSNAVLSMYPSIVAPFTGAITYWGQSNTLSVGAWGTGPLDYQWFDNGNAISGATDETLTLTDIQATNAGFYSVVVTSALGSVTNAPAQVIVEPAGVSLGFSPTLTISGVIGYNYIIQGSTNLSDTNGWATITNLTLTQPVQIWVDTNVNASSPFNSLHFYQVLPGQ